MADLWADAICIGQYFDPWSKPLKKQVETAKTIVKQQLYQNEATFFTFYILLFVT